MILTETAMSATCPTYSLIKSVKSAVYHTSIHVVKHHNIQKVHNCGKAFELLLFTVRKIK